MKRLLLTLLDAPASYVVLFFLSLGWFVGFIINSRADMWIAEREMRRVLRYGVFF